MEPADGTKPTVMGSANGSIQPFRFSPSHFQQHRHYSPSWLVLTQGRITCVWIAVICLEIPVALAWPAVSHGLSGVVYGLLGYLLLIGWLEKKILSILLSLVAFWLYGSAVFALIPGMSPAGVSWIGHASGFAAGIIAAWAVHRESSTDGIRDQ